MLPNSWDRKGKIAFLKECVENLERQSDLCDKERLYQLATDAVAARNWRDRVDRKQDESEQRDNQIMASQSQLLALMSMMWSGKRPLGDLRLVWFERLLASTEEAFSNGQYPSIEDVRSSLRDGIGEPSLTGLNGSCY